MATERQEQKYERILDAALHVFAQKGFHDAKVSEIAKHAGVADGTIYLYFKSKDELLISLFETHLEGINDGLRQRLEDIPGVPERLSEIIHYHLRLAAERPVLAQFITVELRQSAKFMREHAKAQFMEYLDHFGNVIEQGKNDETFHPDVSPGMFKHLLFGALDHAVLTWLGNPNRQPEDLTEIGDRLTEFVLRGLAKKS